MAAVTRNSMQSSGFSCQYARVREAVNVHQLISENIEMGGYGSGKHGGGPVTDDCLRLDVADHRLRVGVQGSGQIEWTATGQVLASVWCEVNASYIELRHTRTGACGAEGEVVRVELVTTPMPFGGRRVWFACPVSGRRVRCLYCPKGQRVFASRAAHGLTYRSQRETGDDRLLRAARKAHARLGGDGNLFHRPTKPKWMRWPTYWTLRADLDQKSLNSAVSAAAKIGIRLPVGAGR